MEHYDHPPPERGGIRWGCVGAAMGGLALILFCIACPVSGTPKHNENSSSAQADISAVRTAIKGYYLEYGRYPISTESHGGSDLKLQSDGDLLAALLGEHTTTIPNPRMIQFLDPKISSRAKGGYHPETKTLYDPWGQPYQILIDANYDNDVPDPEGGEEALSKGILVWSGGEDGQLETWKDNICSWR